MNYKNFAQSSFVVKRGCFFLCAYFSVAGLPCSPCLTRRPLGEWSAASTVLCAALSPRAPTVLYQNVLLVAQMVGENQVF